jgi:hypothetical protein
MALQRRYPFDVSQHQHFTLRGIQCGDGVRESGRKVPDWLLFAPALTP